MNIDDVLADLERGRLSAQDAWRRLQELKSDLSRFPLSEGQRGIWLLQKMTPGSSAYNVPMCFRSRQRIDSAVLDQAFQWTLRQQTMLTVIIEEDDGVPYQRIRPGVAYRVEHEDISSLRVEEVVPHLRRKAQQPLLLNAGPLVRIHLLSRSAQEQYLLVLGHHIVLDGRSLALFLGMLAHAYAALIEGRQPTADRAQSSYRDFVQWEQTFLQSEEGEQHRAFWTKHLSGTLPVLDLPTDYPRASAAVGVRGSSVVRRWDGERSQQLARFCSSEGIRPSLVFLVAFQQLLRRWSGQSDFVLGMPTLGRPQERFESLIGYFINVVPLRCELDDGRTVREVLQATQRAVTQALDHASYPLPALMRQLKVQRIEGRLPVFQAAFEYQSRRAFALGSAPATPGKALFGDRIEGIGQEGEYELVLEVHELAEGYTIILKYDPALFAESTVERWSADLATLLDGIVADPRRSVASVPILNDAERRRVLIDWNATAADFPADRCIHELFSEQAARTPQDMAIAFEERNLTYAELDRRSTRLANALQGLGVGPGAIVGLLLERSPEMLVGLLGILKAGGAYLPLDPTYPETRLRFMLEDSGATVLLTDKQHRDRIRGHRTQTITLDEEWSAVERQPAASVPAPVGSRDLAYVIYTSGSTGKPKGVRVAHGSVVNLLSAMGQLLRIGGTDVWAAITPLSFDIAALELFLPLVQGAKVALMPRSLVLDAPRLCERVDAVGVTVMQATPSLWRMLVEAGWKSTSRKVLCGGEPLPADLACDLASGGAEVWNLYGPTETTIWSTAARVRADAPVSIGRPIANTRVYVLDEHLEPVPVGAIGELCIAGVGVAEGYVNRPEATTERFVADPFVPGQRMYRTGDRVRYRADGELEFIGRTDHQIKIRGHRVELGEVEAALLGHTGVRQAVVAARATSSGDMRLVAYVVCKERAVSDDELRRHLMRTLPEHMIPHAFQALQSLPVTSNGKVDRSALPEPGVEGPKGQGAAEPRTPTEVALREIWAEVLHLPHVGIHDNFFGIGGDSLLAMRVTARIERKLGATVPIGAFMASPTIAALAARIADHGTSGAIRKTLPPIVPDRASRYEPFPLTDVQEAYWIGRQQSLSLGNVAAYAYFELESEWFNPERFERSWQKLIERHEMLRTVILPDGRQQILERFTGQVATVHDFSLRSDSEIESELLALRERLSHQILPTDRPLFSVTVSLLPRARARVHIGIDLIVSDAMSLHILQREFAVLYSDPDATLPPLELSFRDYVITERALRSTELYKESWQYWLARLEDMPAAPPLPLAVDPASIARPRFRQLTGRIDARRWRGIAERAARSGLTPTAVLLTAYADVLCMFSGEARATINLTLFSRLPLHDQVDQIIGDFTSLLPLAVDCRERASFVDRARRIQQRLWEDLDHRVVSGVSIMRERARRAGESSGTTLPVVFTSTLGLTGYGGDDRTRHLQEIAAGSDGFVYGSNQTPQVWLDLQVSERHGELQHVWAHVEGLFPAGVVEGIFDVFCRQLELLSEDESGWHADFPPAPPPESLESRRRANETQVVCPDVRLEELFLTQAERQPEAPAVIDGRGALSYLDVERRSGALAQRLWQLTGGRPGMVAVVMQKGWEQIVAVLAILRAGAAYVPIDPSQPAERLAHMIADCGATVALTQSWIEDGILWPAGLPRVAVDCESQASDAQFAVPVRLSTDDLAYVIYTSGSTGVPKGVMISHRGAVNTILDVNGKAALSAADRVFSVSALSFDLSVYDIFGVLAAGGAIVLPDPSPHPEPQRWLARMIEGQVTVWNSVPALLDLLLEAAEMEDMSLPRLRVAMISGDWIPLGQPKRLWSRAPDARVLAMGGATEASIWSIYKWVDAVDPDWKSIPYGMPLANQSFHVLDAHLRPCPEWTPGELYIGGVGLALGYFRDEALTARSFISHPETGERLYRTGDMGRYRSGGEIEFLGRRDSQVKILGQRIELGEIESVIARDPQVRHSVVRVDGKPGGAKRLVAYVVPAEPADGADADVQFSLFYFADSNRQSTELYDLYVEGAKFADRNGFTAVWTPERHFTQVAAAFPNPSVLSAALATVTERIHLRAGSVVLPLHDPVRVAEEWAVVDQLSRGRAGVSFVAGWVPDDFIFAPEAYPTRHQVLFEKLDQVRRLWRGESVTRRNGAGQSAEIRSLPRPVQPELPTWLTCSRSAANFEAAGRLGLNVLTALLSLSMDELADNLAVYRRALLDHGHDPKSRTVTVMLHAFVAETDEAARNLAREPLKAYFRAHTDLRDRIVRELGAQGIGGRSDVETLVSASVERYLHSSALIGSPATCLQVLRRLKDMGVGEIACLIDFGLESAVTLAHLPHLRTLADLSRRMFDEQAFRTRLGARLPAYMVPESIVVLDRLPLTANGKIDRKALPVAPDLAATREYIAPRTATERALAKIWAEVLGLPRVGIHDHFFELGGHSILAMKVVSGVLDALEVTLPLRALFEAPTVESLARIVDDALVARTPAGEEVGVI